MTRHWSLMAHALERGIGTTLGAAHRCSDQAAIQPVCHAEPHATFFSRCDSIDEAEDSHSSQQLLLDDGSESNQATSNYGSHCGRIEVAGGLSAIERLAAHHDNPPLQPNAA